MLWKSTYNSPVKCIRNEVQNLRNLRVNVSRKEASGWKKNYEASNEISVNKIRSTGNVIEKKDEIS